ncbi:hypothetical protein UPYG_G00207300 [Umbra pygmaea]|uniref:NXPE family member 3-like n=1 Tax=Umbra pygmaea TaxID=75934 RepID=A0ABD0WK68_UMBPY
MRRHQLFILFLISSICIYLLFVWYDQHIWKVSKSNYLVFNHSNFSLHCTGKTNRTFQPISDPLISVEEWELLVKNLQWSLPPEALSTKESTDATKCSFSIVNPDSNHMVGGFVDVTVTARDAQARRKTYGGDFFQAKLYNTELKASTYGSVTDHCNGTYTVRLSLLWPGPAEVSIRLVHSSEAVQVLWRQREQDPDKVFFHGYFEGGGKQETAICNAQRSTKLVGDGKQCCCDYIDSVTGDPWFCRRPSSLPCHSLYYHSMGGYQAVLTEAEKAILKSSTNIIVPGKNAINVQPQTTESKQFLSHKVTDKPVYNYRTLSDRCGS